MQGPHFFRPEELSKILERVLKHTAMDPHTAQTVKLMLRLLATQNKKQSPTKQVDLQKMAQMLELILQKKNPKMELALIARLVMKALKENEKGNTINIKQICELAMKALANSASLSKEEKQTFAFELSKLTMLTPLLKKPESLKTPEEKMIQIGIYDAGGNLVDILEGIFNPASKAGIKLLSILALDGVDAFEKALEDMGIIQLTSRSHSP